MEKKKEKSLQKLTDLEILFNKDKVELSDLKNLPKSQISRIIEYINHNLNTLEGYERDKFITKMDAILTREHKNIIWQANHVSINNSIHRLIQDYNRLPAVSEIAKDSKLSRQTVTKHLKEFSSNELFQTEIDKYHLMLYSLMDRLYLAGIQQRNIKAIRLFFEILTYKTQNLSGNITNQNNFIQINNTKIDKVIIDNLPPEAKKEIEKIIIDSNKGQGVLA